MPNITLAKLTAILRQMDAEASKSERFIKTASADMKSIHSHAARTMRKAMSLFVYGVGPENFDGKPFIDFRIPMPEEFEPRNFMEQPD